MFKEMAPGSENFIIYGAKPTVSIHEGLFGNFVYNSLLRNDVTHECMVDAFTKQTRSYRSLLEDTCTLAQALHNYGVNSSTVVSVSSENSLRYFDGPLASFYLGATVAPINHMYTKTELSHIIKLYQPKIIFCSKETLEKYVALKKDYNFIEKIILIEGEESLGVENMQTFIQNNLGTTVLSPELFKPFNEADPKDHVAILLSSSGTTGLPKGVMLTDENLLVRIAQSREPLYSFQPIIGYNTLGLMPFYHAFGFTVFMNGIVNQERIIVMRQFQDDVFLSAIQDYKISVIVAAPPLAVFLSKSPKVEKYNLSCVKEVVFGAAPLSKEIEISLKKRLKSVLIRQGYGLTESTFGVMFVTRKCDKLKSGSSGTVISHMTLTVKDPETEKSLGPNQTGEICIKGPMVMKGYIGNPQATKDTFTTDGWLKTGDLGYYDEDNYFFIIDRLKELIKYKGYQVAPAELEALLLDHPKVLDVGVVGAPDELAGELPVGFIVKKPGVDITEKELIDYVAKNMSPQKRLRGGIIFMNAIPKSPSGKILRRELKKLVTTAKGNIVSKL